jgi:hypothetical protein
MRFSYTVIGSNNSNIVLANFSFDDDLILIVVVIVVVSEAVAYDTGGVGMSEGDDCCAGISSSNNSNSINKNEVSVF